MIQICDHFPMVRWDHMRRFISEAYRPDHILCSRKYFEWLFKTKEAESYAQIMCAWEGDNLKSIIGYLNLSVYWGSTKTVFPAVGLTHWISLKDAPLGIGWLLARKVVDRFDLLMTINASKVGAPFFRARGWNYCERIPRYLCVFDRNTCLEMTASRSVSNLGKLLFAPSTDLSTDYTIDFSNYAPDWEIYPQMSFSITRSIEYLQWRYLEHPVFDYQMAMAGSNKRPAVCVYRIEKAYGSCEALVGRIVDFYHPDDDQGRVDGVGLVQNVMNEMCKSGCAFAEFYCTSEAYIRSLLTVGGGIEPPGQYILPSRLTPIQQGRRDLNLAFSCSKTLPVPNTIELYLTNSDIDGDQPVYLDSDGA